MVIPLVGSFVLREWPALCGMGEVCELGFEV